MLVGIEMVENFPQNQNIHLQKGEIAVGIDLGTTFSAVAWISDSRPSIVLNAEDERLTMSVVAFKDQTTLVGSRAWQHAQVDPYSGVLQVKRQMGNPSFFFMAPDGRSLPAEEISALILKKLKVDAEKRLDKQVTHAVISVPAYFNDAQRRATKKAAEIAGLKVLRLVNEPTAASIAYGAFSARKDQTVLIYDLGGGTFDVTILSVSNERFTVLSTNGDYKLGGIDFDNRLIMYLSKQYERITGNRLPDDPVIKNYLRLQAESAKKHLSSNENVIVQLDIEGQNTEIEVTRPVFEDLIRDLIDLTLFHVSEALSDASLDPEQLDKIILIGGSSRIPLIREMLRERLDINPSHSLNPDEAVAMGSAILADQCITPAIQDEENASAENDKLPGDQKTAETTPRRNFIIEDVTSHSLGIEARNPQLNRLEVTRLIAKNTKIPARHSQIFTTIRHGQTAVDIKVYEGESKEIPECVLIGGFKLDGLPSDRPAGIPIEVTMFYNTNGIIEVSAIDLPTKKAAKVTIHYEHDLSDEQTRTSTARVTNAETDFLKEWEKI